MKWKQYDCNKINLSSDWQKNVKTQDGRRVKLTFQNAVSIGGVIEGCNDDGKPVESLIAWDKFTGYAPGAMQLVMVEDETKLEMKMTIKEELCQVNHQLEAVRLKLKLQEHLALSPNGYRSTSPVYAMNQLMNISQLSNINNYDYYSGFNKIT